MPGLLTIPSTARGTICAISILCLILMSAVARPAADVSGTWDLKIETREGTGSPVVVLAQDGKKLSGTYKGRMGESPLEGTIQDDSIQFSVKLRFREQTVNVTYSGIVRGSEMSGSVRFGDSGDGKWSARRRQ
jgi:hypothetical protein